MRATKLLSVSVALWAVVVGADSASAGGNLPIVTPQIKPVLITPKVGTPVIRPTSSPIKSLGSTTSLINPRLTTSSPSLRFNHHIYNSQGGGPSNIHINVNPSKAVGAGVAAQAGAALRQGSGNSGKAVLNMQPGMFLPGTGNYQTDSYAFTPPPPPPPGAPTLQRVSGAAAGGGSGGGRPARNYAPPTSYNSKTACGRYPYPACQ